MSTETAAVPQMVAFALEQLPGLQRPSGLFCFDAAFVERDLRGESIRYSLMALLGLQRATRAGYDTSAIDLDELLALCIKDPTVLGPGDLGLAVWACTRQEVATSGTLLEEIDRRLPNTDSLKELLGMEFAWVVIGVANAAQHEPLAEKILHRLLEHLPLRRSGSGLYYHHGGSGTRRNLPNFATEIYTLLALATLARHNLSATARSAAEQLAALLVELQRPDGAWPWLYHANRGTVVEDYEVYSVHQDAMAPMAFVELTEVTGDERFAAAARAGLAWSTGSNELAVELLDYRAGFAHRSIRRVAPWDRLALAANVGSMVTTGRRIARRHRSLERNATMRPYHLGWILEAWAGRERAGCGENNG